VSAKDAGASGGSLPLWQKIVAAAYVVLVVVLVVAFSGRIGPDFWPLDSSRVGPNIVAAVVTVLVMTPLGVLVYPPTRRWLELRVDRVVAPIHEHLRRAHAHAEWQARATATMVQSLTGAAVAPHPHFDVSPAARREIPMDVVGAALADPLTARLGAGPAAQFLATVGVFVGDLSAAALVLTLTSTPPPKEEKQ
jgi:hypothetical protein